MVAVLHSTFRCFMRRKYHRITSKYSITYSRFCSNYYTRSYKTCTRNNDACSNTRGARLTLLSGGIVDLPARNKTTTVRARDRYASQRSFIKISAPRTKDLSNRDLSKPIANFLYASGKIKIPH